MDSFSLWMKDVFPMRIENMVGRPLTLVSSMNGGICLHHHLGYASTVAPLFFKEDARKRGQWTETDEHGVLREALCPA
jgi:hypothetical protein